MAEFASGFLHGIITFYDNTINALMKVKDFFTGLFEIIYTTLEFIPQPFLTMTLIFIPIFIASIMYKILRG